MAEACLSVLDFSPAGIVIRVGQSPAECRLFFTWLANNRATLLSVIIAHLRPGKYLRTHSPTRSSRLALINPDQEAKPTRICRTLSIKEHNKPNGKPRRDRSLWRRCW